MIGCPGIVIKAIMHTTRFAAMLAREKITHIYIQDKALKANP